MSETQSKLDESIEETIHQTDKHTISVGYEDEKIKLIKKSNNKKEKLSLDRDDIKKLEEIVEKDMDIIELLKFKEDSRVFINYFRGDKIIITEVLKETEETHSFSIPKEKIDTNKLKIIS